MSWNIFIFLLFTLLGLSYSAPTDSGTDKRVTVPQDTVTQDKICFTEPAHHCSTTLEEARHSKKHHVVLTGNTTYCVAVKKSCTPVIAACYTGNSSEILTTCGVQIGHATLATVATTHVNDPTTVTTPIPTAPTAATTVPTVPTVVSTAPTAVTTPATIPTVPTVVTTPATLPTVATTPATIPTVPTVVTTPTTLPTVATTPATFPTVSTVATTPSTVPIVVTIVTTVATTPATIPTVVTTVATTPATVPTVVTAGATTPATVPTTTTTPIPTTTTTTTLAPTTNPIPTTTVATTRATLPTTPAPTTTTIEMFASLKCAKKLGLYQKQNIFSQSCETSLRRSTKITAYEIPEMFFGLLSDEGQDMTNLICTQTFYSRALITSSFVEIEDRCGKEESDRILKLFNGMRDCLNCNPRHVFDANF